MRLYLKAQGMGQPMFESRLRSDLALKQVVGAVAEGADCFGYFCRACFRRAV
jgi:hypothetical protein